MNYLSHPYFYVIRDKRNGILYAGSKFSKKDSYPELFWKEGGYFTSSPTIHNIISEHGSDVFEVVKLKLIHNAYEYETRFLKKVDAKNNPKFYNSHNNSKLSFGDKKYEERMIAIYGVTNPNYVPEIKSKAIAKMTKTKNSPEWKSSIGAIATQKRMASMDYEQVGKKQSETKQSKEWKETKGKKAKERESLTKASKEWKETVGKGQIEKRMAAMDYNLMGKKLSKTITDLEWIKNNFRVCEHCGKGPMNPSNYKRWHSSNCRFQSN